MKQPAQSLFPITCTISQLVVTISPTLTLNEIKGGAEVPRDSTSPPASTLLSLVSSHSCGSALTC